MFRPFGRRSAPEIRAGIRSSKIVDDRVAHTDKVVRRRHLLPARFSDATLWFYFVASTFAVFVLVAAVSTLILLLILHMGWLSVPAKGPFFPLMMPVLSSLALGSFLTALVGRKILSPMTVISRAMQEVAKGDFTLQLKEDYSIKALRDMASNFNTMVRELSSIETLRNDFVSHVSHEFKSPLASIEGYAMLLQSRELSPSDREEYGRLVIESTHQLSTLTTNILKISKLERLEHLEGKNHFSLDEQLRQAVLILEPGWSAKEIELDLNLPATRCFGDEPLLMQVWLNLIGNGIKFMDRGGVLTVSIITHSKELEVLIADTGIGMDDTVCRHMFEKFYQGDRSRNSEGNGLGLALVKRIIDLSKGSIEVDSAPEKGTRITVRLPQDGM